MSILERCWDCSLDRVLILRTSFWIARGIGFGGAYSFETLLEFHLDVNVLSLCSLDLFPFDFSYCVWHLLEEICLKLISPR